MKHIKKFESFSINEEEELFGKARKFMTGYESSEERDKAMLDFNKALDAAEEKVSKNPDSYVFKREQLEKQAKENDYKGGLRMQRGGRRSDKIFIVYDKGVSGFQKLAGGAGDLGHRR